MSGRSRPGRARSSATPRPSATARWREVGECIAGDAPPMQIVEMNLRRVGDTDWPAAGAVPMR